MSPYIDWANGFDLEDDGPVVLSSLHWAVKRKSMLMKTFCLRETELVVDQALTLDTVMRDFDGSRLKVLALNRQDITNLDFLANTPVLEELDIEGCRSWWLTRH